MSIDPASVFTGEDGEAFVDVPVKSFFGRKTFAKAKAFILTNALGIPVAVDADGNLCVTIRGAAGAVTINVDEADLAAFGSIEAPAYTDATGAANGTLVGILKGMFTKAAGTQSVMGTVSANEVPIANAVTITPSDSGTVAAGRQLAISCSTPGNVKIGLSGGSSVIIPVTAGLTVLPWAVTKIFVTGTSAVATYANLS